MRKGFTLIELLAVIILLAIITVIVTPKILNIINDTRKSSSVINFKKYLEAVELSINEYKLNEEEIKNATYLVDKNGNLCEESKGLSCANPILVRTKNSPNIGSKLTIENGKINKRKTLLKFNDYNCFIEKSVNCIIDNIDLVHTDHVILQIDTTMSDKNLYDYKIYGNSVQEGEPSLQNPAMIESVGNRTKNLYNPEWDTRFTRQEDGSYLSNTIITTEANILGNKKLPIGIYTISIKVKSPVGMNYRIEVMYTDGTKSGVYATSNGEYIDFHFTTEMKQIEKIYWNYGSSSDKVQFKDFQIEEGTVGTDYEPYGKYKISIKVSGKNLYDRNTYPLTDNMWINGEYGNLVIQSIGHSAIVDYIPCTHLRNKTITLTLNDTTVGYPGIAFYDSNKNFISGQPNNNGTKITTIVPSDAVYLRFCVNSNYVDKAMIELGEEVTEYEPYKAKIYNIYLDEPLRKIGDNADYIDFYNKKIVRKVEVIDETGTLPINESFKVMENFKIDDIDLPNITINKGINFFEIQTKIKPSSTEIKYYK